MTPHDSQDQPPGADIAAAPGGLLDLVRVAAIVADTAGRIVLWSPEAERLFGYPAPEALGRPVLQLLFTPEKLPLALELFDLLQEGKGWAGVFPVRHKDGSDRQVEFRTISLRDRDGSLLALALAVERETLRKVETDLALSDRLINQSPIGILVFGTDLRCIRVNAALTRLDGLPAEIHLGRRVGEFLPTLDTGGIEALMRRVLHTGNAVLDQRHIGRIPADPGHDHVLSISYHRLDDPSGRVIGLVASVIDVSERHRATQEALDARDRLAVIADAAVRIGTTLDLQQTARELADVAVPRLADLAIVEVLDAALASDDGAAVRSDGPATFHALAVSAGYPAEAIHAASRVGEAATYETWRLIVRAVREARPILIPRVDAATLRRIARDDRVAAALARDGVHSYLAAPLIARGDVLGAISLYRTVNPRPFGEQDLTLVSELAARAAVSIDNARLYGRERDTALTLQRSLLPQQPPAQGAMEIAARYRPSGQGREIGGDWFDVLPLKEGKVGLVVGDVMGSGVRAAAIMGQLRTAIRALASLDLHPAEVLEHLDDIAETLSDSFATCLYAVCDPSHHRCSISSAGHLPPVLVSPDGAAEFIEVPTAAPLGVGGVPFRTVELGLPPGALLAFYTDGLVENRREDIDIGLQALLRLLKGAARPLEDICDMILDTLGRASGDDVALLLARLRRRAETKKEAEDRDAMPR